jgi:DNA-binding transcriptional ArsR family regulator
VRAYKIITNPKAFELLADETRRRLIYLLRAKDLTVSQIAEQLDKTPQVIYHHIRKLTAVGMVEVAKEERVSGHFIETYYRASAELFQLNYGEAKGKEYHEQHTREALQVLVKLGLTKDIDENVISRLVDLVRKIDQLGMKHASTMQEKVAKMEGIDFLTKQTVSDYIKLLSVTEAQFEDLLKLERELRLLLKSTLSEDPATVARQARAAKP